MSQFQYEAPTVEFLGDGMSQEEHAKVVMQVKEDIISGRIFSELGLSPNIVLLATKCPSTKLP